MIYLCRHGETAWTKSGQHTSRTDLELTDVGRSQAAELARTLKQTSFKKVLSSPLKRAKQTAELAGFHPLIDPDLTEWDYGDYEGKTSAEIGKGWNLFRDGAPGGESLEAIRLRADRVLHKLTDGPILLFSHGHFLRVLAARWMGLEVSVGAKLTLSVASVSILGHEREIHVIKLWNSTSHL
jgi:broad specificity phosphatase PhoE